MLPDRMPSLRRHEGLLLIDHSASPGTPEVPEGARLELPTVTCCHCNRVVVLNMARTRPRGYCAKCDHYVCDLPACNAECNPILQAVELANKYPDSGQPFLLRGPRGEVLFDPEFRDRERIFRSGAI